MAIRSGVPKDSPPSTSDRGSSSEIEGWTAHLIVPKFFFEVLPGGFSMTLKRTSAVRGFLSVAIVVGGLTFSFLPAGAAGAAQVGAASRHYVDDHRRNWDGTGPRPLETAIWYPTTASIPPVASRDGFFNNPDVIQDAPITDAARKYPLIVISHGTGGCASGMLWLGHYLAAQGYIVAAANHHGNTCAEAKLDPRGFLLWWERPQDLTAILNHLLADPVWGARIDRRRIGAAGFSLGGYTMIAIAGGRIDRGRYMKFCASPARDFTCGPQPEFPQAPELFQQLEKTDPIVQEALRHSGDSYRDPRIRAVLAIAPVFGEGFAAKDVADIKIPVQIVVGAGDTVAPPATNGKYFGALIPGSRLVVIPGQVGHYDFVPVCTEQGKKASDPNIRRLCHDAPDVDRQKVQNDVKAIALGFFDKNVAGDTE
jgi:predicted dienelactone hydrolase